MAMQTSIRHLRSGMKSIMDAVQAGEDVIVCSHGQPIAKISKIQPEQRSFENIGFGMWGDDSRMEDVNAYARKLRKGRHHDS